MTQTNHECILYSHVLDGKGGLVANEASTASAPPTPDATHWSHIEYTRPGALEWLISQGIPDVAAESMTRAETRPRTFVFEGGTLLNLRGINLNPGADAEDMVSVRVWFSKRRIVTARQRRLLSVDDILSDFAANKGPRNEGEFLISLVEHLATRIGEAVDDIEDRLAMFEDNEINHQQMRANLSAMRRKTAALRRFLAPQRDALESMYRATKEILQDDESHQLREQADRITRYVEDLDLSRERALVLQEELQNRIAQEQNSRAYLLTIVATIFLPLGFLTGVFGMNVAGLPGTEDPAAFGYLSWFMLLVGALLMAAMRWKKWW